MDTCEIVVAGGMQLAIQEPTRDILYATAILYTLEGISPLQERTSAADELRRYLAAPDDFFLPVAAP